MEIESISITLYSAISTPSVSKKENSSHIQFQEASNDKVVIAR